MQHFSRLESRNLLLFTVEYVNYCGIKCYALLTHTFRAPTAECLSAVLLVGSVKAVEISLLFLYSVD